MHASEIPQANYWQKVICQEAIKALGPRDYCGLVFYGNTDQWLWAQSQGGMVRVGQNRQMMLARIDRMAIGDMPAFDGAMRMGAAAFARIFGHIVPVSHGERFRFTGRRV